MSNWKSDFLFNRYIKKVYIDKSFDEDKGVVTNQRYTGEFFQQSINADNIINYDENDIRNNPIDTDLSTVIIKTSYKKNNIWKYHEPEIKYKLDIDKNFLFIKSLQLIQYDENKETSGKKEIYNIWWCGRKNIQIVDLSGLDDTDKRDQFINELQLPNNRKSKSFLKFMMGKNQNILKYKSGGNPEKVIPSDKYFIDQESGFVYFKPNENKIKIDSTGNDIDLSDLDETDFFYLKNVFLYVGQRGKKLFDSSDSTDMASLYKNLNNKIIEIENSNTEAKTLNNSNGIIIDNSKIEININNSGENITTIDNSGITVSNIDSTKKIKITGEHISLNNYEIVGGGIPHGSIRYNATNNSIEVYKQKYNGIGEANWHSIENSYNETISSIPAAPDLLMRQVKGEKGDQGEAGPPPSDKDIIDALKKVETQISVKQLDISSIYVIDISVTNVLAVNKIKSFDSDNSNNINLQQGTINLGSYQVQKSDLSHNDMYVYENNDEYSLRIYDSSGTGTHKTLVGAPGPVGPAKDITIIESTNVSVSNKLTIEQNGRFHLNNTGYSHINASAGEIRYSVKRGLEIYHEEAWNGLGSKIANNSGDGGAYINTEPYLNAPANDCALTFHIKNQEKMRITNDQFEINTPAFWINDANLCDYLDNIKMRQIINAPQYDVFDVSHDIVVDWSETPVNDISHITLQFPKTYVDGGSKVQYAVFKFTTTDANEDVFYLKMDISQSVSEHTQGNPYTYETDISNSKIKKRTMKNGGNPDISGIEDNNSDKENFKIKLYPGVHTKIHENESYVLQIKMVNRIGSSEWTPEKTNFLY